MKWLLTSIVTLFVCMLSYAQQEFHVFPENHNETPGTPEGTGSINKPWDLQTALNQTSDNVGSGDTIWIHEGIYNGRYKSRLKSLEPNQYITVSAFKNDKVILNGNVPVKQNSVLEVVSTRVIYKNFEVTWLGEFSRDQKDADFEFCFGIEHLTGENCRFYNIIIHNNPGLGIGSWKNTAGTIIENCIIYNNGFMAKEGVGRGEGIYVQNKSEETRLIKNNIIFNNYYKAIEVWSAGKRANFQFVKNVTLEGNILFNSGSPSGVFRDNVIVASNDQNGINIANNITLLNNILYHNTHNENGKRIGEAPSLTLGFNKHAPVKDITVKGNVIVGGYNALRLSIAESLNFTDNTIYGAVQVGPNTSGYLENWNFNSNTFYTKLKTPFRVSRGKKYSLEAWQKTFQLDKNSALIDNSNLNLNRVLHISRHHQNAHKYNVALFSSDGNDVVVDFSKPNLKAGLNYKIYDVENLEVILQTGTLSEDLKIVFPMQLTAFEKPLHNSIAKKTLSNFGVFVIEFEDQRKVQVSEDNEDQPNVLERFFSWLGF
ncbi:right-handed parallel beta-helix repeat-containing protein [Psychroserpens mesophilus]|uniref:right-handed parallel beta-helix repeat-containing protein n=1 Tax=Psychroserpens mesophilus TaxID=325473 RepID=UPI003D648747